MIKESRKFVWLWLVSVAWVACAPVATKSTSSTSYYEDLAPHRPAYSLPQDTQGKATSEPAKRPPMGATQDITQVVNQALDTIAATNRLSRYIDCYTIQVYSGNSRSDATMANGKVLTTLPDIPSEVVYAQPYFRVRAGKYFSRLEAHRDLSIIKRSFPNAILVMEKFPIEP
jgi:hypothetical protein